MTSDVSAPGAAEETRWLDAEEQKAWRAWLYSSMLLQDRLDRELTHETGISHAYYEILVQLSEAPCRMLRMSELAERSLSSRSRLSHAVARLEERGWVRRETVPSDRRGAVAVLTDAGFTALEAAAPIHVDGVRRHLFDRLTRDQVAALAEISRTISEHLGASSPG